MLSRFKRLLSWKTAVAEILVLIIGIVAALAVDRWAEERRDAATAKEYISRLERDVAADLQAYADTAAWSRAIDDSAVFVLGVYRGSDPAPEEYDQFALHLFRASWGSRGESTTTTYDDLVSTGNMALLPVAVRDSITGDYSLRSAYERRLDQFEAVAIRGYWRVPARVLGADLTPEVWLRIQGRTHGFKLKQGDIGLSEGEAKATIARLRATDDLEALLAQIRHQMVQRELLFGERLPAAATKLIAVLQDAS